MNAEQFTYWLNGFAELNPELESPTADQWRVIQDHLKTVFLKVTPPFPVAAPNPLHKYFEKIPQEFFSNSAVC